MLFAKGYCLLKTLPYASCGNSRRGLRDLERYED